MARNPSSSAEIAFVPREPPAVTGTALYRALRSIGVGQGIGARTWGLSVTLMALTAVAVPGFLLARGDLLSQVRIAVLTLCLAGALLASLASGVRGREVPGMIMIAILGGIALVVGAPQAEGPLLLPLTAGALAIGLITTLALVKPVLRCARGQGDAALGARVRIAALLAALTFAFAFTV